MAETSILPLIMACMVLFEQSGTCFGVTLPAVFEQAKHDGFAAHIPTAFAAHPPLAKTTFVVVEFDDNESCLGQLGWHGVPRQESVTQTQIERIGGARSQGRESAHFRNGQIQGKEPQ